jgi:hypothetical protein
MSNNENPIRAILYSNYADLFKNTDRALIFSQIKWWLENSQNFLAPNGQNYIKKSGAELKHHFKHLSDKTIRRHVYALRDMKVIDIYVPEFDQGTPSNYFKVNTKVLNRLLEDNNLKPPTEVMVPVYNVHNRVGQNDQGGLVKLSGGVGQNDHIIKNNIDIYNINNKHIVAKEQKINKSENPNAKQMTEKLVVMFNALPDCKSLYVGMVNEKIKQILLSTLVSFDEWWKLYHKLLGRKPQDKAKCKIKWNKFSTEDKEGLLLATIFEWLEKQIEGDMRGEPVPVKMAHRFMNVAEIHDADLIISSACNALNNLQRSGIHDSRIDALQPYNHGEYLDGFRKSTTKRKDGQTRQQLSSAIQGAYGKWRAEGSVGKMGYDHGNGQQQSLPQN